jgi:hypothetical protein
VPIFGLFKGRYRYEKVIGVCGGRETEEGGRKFIHLGRSLVLQDKKPKIAEEDQGKKEWLRVNE